MADKSTFTGVARFAVRRFAWTLPTLLAASLAIFLIMRSLPGDIVLTILSGTPHTEQMREELRQELGLNDPMVTQYLRWLESMIDGSFGGISMETREPIGQILYRQIPVTGLLVLYSTVIGVIVFIPLGIIAGYHRNRWPDIAIRAITMGGFSLPHILTANILLIVLLTAFRWSPPIIYMPPSIDLSTHASIMLWPSVLLGWEVGSHLARATRTGVAENLDRQHVLAARGRGLSETSVVVKYAFRNALMPVSAEVGIQIGTLMSGAIVLESLFGLPGIGRGLAGAALARDFPVVMSVGILLIAGYSVLSTVLEVLYALIDPRTLQSTNLSTGSRT